jgi:enamine deaminase RidA (YjgF/YER057c/UK114 family)
LSGRVEGRLRSLGIVLPDAPPPRQARIRMTRIAAGFLFVSGQLPSQDGEIKYVGRVGAEIDLPQAQAAARLSALNVLAHARAALDGDLDRIAQVTYVRGYVTCAPGFTDVAQAVNGASDLLVQVFGEEIGPHARTALGVAMMPYGAAIEVDAQFLLDR